MSRSAKFVVLRKRSFRLVARALLLAGLFVKSSSATNRTSRCATSERADPSKVHVAVCLVGAARSFAESSVHKSLESHVLDGLESEGAVITLLPMLKLVDLRGNDLEAHFEGITQEAIVRNALSFVGACNEHVNLTTGLVLHNVSRCGFTTLSRQEESAGGTGRSRINNTFRNWQSALSQLQAAYTCGQRVTALEAQTPQRRFAWVLRTRADLRYTGPVWPPVQALDPNTVYKVRDWLEMIPRSNFSLTIAATLPLPATTAASISPPPATTTEAAAAPTASSIGQGNEAVTDQASPWLIALGSAWRRWLACTPGFKPGSSLVEAAVTAGDGERWRNRNQQQPPLTLTELPKEWGGAPHIKVARPDPRAGTADQSKSNATTANVISSVSAPLDMAARWAMHRAAVELNGSAPAATLGISAQWEYPQDRPLDIGKRNSGSHGVAAFNNSTSTKAVPLMEKKPIATAKPIVGKPLGRPFLCPAVHRELTCRDVFPHPAPGANFSTAAQMSGITEESREDERNALASPTLRFAVVITGLVRSWAFCAQRLQSQLLDHSAPGSVDIFIHMAINQSDACHRRALNSSASIALHPAVGVMHFRGYPLACSSGGGVVRMSSSGNGRFSGSNSSSNSHSSPPSPLETYPLVGQLRSLLQAFAMMADPDQYAAIIRFRSDLSLTRPLNLSAAVIALGNHPSSRVSNGHFLVLPCRNIGWDVTYFGTPPAMRALMSAGVDGCDGAFDSQPWRAAARHGFVMPREPKNSSSLLSYNGNSSTANTSNITRFINASLEGAGEVFVKRLKSKVAPLPSSWWEWTGGVSGHHLEKGFRFSDELIDNFALGLAAPNPPLTSLEGKVLESEKLHPSSAVPYFTPKRAHDCRPLEHSMFDPRHGHHGRHAPAANIVQEGSDEERGRPSVPCAPLFRVQGYGGVLRDYFKGDLSLHSCPNPLWLHPPGKVNMTQLTPVQQKAHLAAVKASKRPPFPPQGCHLPAVAFDICGGPSQGLSCRDWARSRADIFQAFD